MRLIEDAVFLIRDWTNWCGSGAWKHFESMADDARRCAAYDDSHPEHRTSFGDLIGGAESAVRARKAEKQYRLAAWVLKRVDEGRDAFLAAKAKADAEAEEARIAALPRVNAWGRPL
jgi:hypothetical protein